MALVTEHLASQSRVQIQFSGLQQDSDRVSSKFFFFSWLSSWSVGLHGRPVWFSATSSCFSVLSLRYYFIFLKHSFLPLSDIPVNHLAQCFFDTDRKKLWLKKAGAVFTVYPKMLLWGKQLSIHFRKLLVFEKLHAALCVTVCIFLHVVFLTSTLSFYVKYFPLGSFQVSVSFCVKTHLNISTQGKLRAFPTWHNWTSLTPATELALFFSVLAKVMRCWLH